jgi:ectoine hydroxylase-related dioxygenase (phytanoyl-CoA dioxygenase family)
MEPLAPKSLSREQFAHFWTHGYLHVPGLFTGDTLEELSAEMDRLMAEWANLDVGWTGDWRKAYMDSSTEKKSKLLAMHDLWYYSAAWMRAVTQPKLIAIISDLLGPDVELHHSTMHVKPPETGHPFPMHQDDAFYAHQDNRYVDVLLHLDDTSHQNGEIRFLDGSHKRERIEHIVTTRDGQPCTPHLPTDRFRLEDTVPVPARAGDVVLFNLFTVHGSHLNQTDRPRRMVRIGYRHPDNQQIGGQSHGRPSWMMCGRRRRRPGAELFPQS